MLCGWRPATCLYQQLWGRSPRRVPADGAGPAAGARALVARAPPPPLLPSTAQSEPGAAQAGRAGARAGGSGALRLGSAAARGSGPPHTFTPPAPKLPPYRRAPQSDAEATTEKYGLEAGLFKALTSTDEEAAAAGKSRGQQAKELLKRYGSAYLITSISFAIVSFGLCYAAVSAGGRAGRRPSKWKPRRALPRVAACRQLQCTALRCTPLLFGRRRGPNPQRQPHCAARAVK